MEIFPVTRLSYDRQVNLAALVLGKEKHLKFTKLSTSKNLKTIFKNAIVLIKVHLRSQIRIKFFQQKFRFGIGSSQVRPRTHVY